MALAHLHTNSCNIFNLINDCFMLKAHNSNYGVKGNYALRAN